VATRIILQAPAGRAALIRGMVRMARLLRVTLGPVARTVIVEPMVQPRTPEVLDSAATIARRLTGVGDPFEDMGAMIVRHLAWRVFEQVGDGVATSAVLTQAIVEQAHVYLTAGGNPVDVKRGLERALDAAREELRRQARVVEEPEEIAGLVTGTVRDPDLAARIGSIVDAVGPDGSIQIEDGEGVETTWEYLDGIRWDHGYVSPHLLRPGETMARVLEPRILVTDQYIERAEQLLPALEVCSAAGERNLMVIAPEVRDPAIALMVVNRDKGAFDSIVAAKAPLFGAQMRAVVEDLAVITGGRAILEGRADSLERVTVDDLGRARQVWITHSHFGVLGGRGDKAAIRERIRQAKLELRGVDDDEWVRERIRERIGKLAGLAAIIKVGAPTPSDQAELKPRVEAAVRSARAAVQDGVVPGGGAALLACTGAVESLALDGDEAVGARILARALSEPMRALVQNAGLEAGAIVGRAHEQPPGWTFDVVAGVWVDAWKAGILDPLPMVMTALETAVSAAGIALTSEVLIHDPKASVSVQP